MLGRFLDLQGYLSSAHWPMCIKGHDPLRVLFGATSMRYGFFATLATARQLITDGASHQRWTCANLPCTWERARVMTDRPEDMHAPY